VETISIQQLKQRAQAQPQPFEIHAQIETLATRTSKSGKPFLEAKLADAADQFVLRAWEDTALYPALGAFQAGDFLAVRGSWTKGDFGVEPRDAAVQALTGDQVELLLRGPEALQRRQAEDFATIGDFVRSMADPRMRGLGQLYLDRFGERFRRTAAARNYHHARRGGLVEHVAQMMRSADAICGVYPALNRDLVLTGVLFHDCGKLWENVYQERGFEMPYTEVGELLGHIPAGMELVNRLWRDLVDSPAAVAWQRIRPDNDSVRLHILHLIGSHHGEYEFGSPVLPRTPEAAALHYVDNLDAKLEMFAQGYTVAAALGKNVFERVRPLPANLVRPLPKYGEEGS
jgi:3'-5' exoribonuclease